MNQYIPNDQRFLVIPVFNFEDHEQGKFKEIRIRADEIIGYHRHEHELSHGEDHVYMIEGTAIQFKSFEAQCSPLTIHELSFLFYDDAALSERLVNFYSRNRMGIICPEFKNQKIVYDKIAEIKKLHARNYPDPASVSNPDSDPASNPASNPDHDSDPTYNDKFWDGQ